MSLVIIQPGDKYGCYTVLEVGVVVEGKKDTCYLARCDCGSERVVTRTTLLRRPDKCKWCRGRHYSQVMADKREALVGTVVNGFRIVASLGLSSDKKPKALYMAECTICGDTRQRTISSMNYKKGERCSACPPDYGFTIDGGTAVGHIQNGIEFKIDTEDIPVVSQNFWYVNGGGYLFHRDAQTRMPIRMHRVILGLTDDTVVVDHLNHDKLDNRKANLRIVTQAENCCNNSLRSTNTLGFVGVRIQSGGERGFLGHIQKGGLVYNLISTASSEDAAQAYNVAADYLFGVGIGHRNHVYYPDEKFAQNIIAKIKAIDAETEAGGSSNGMDSEDAVILECAV